MDVASAFNERMAGLPALLGLRFTFADQDRIAAELLVRDDMCTVPGILHGGAIMAFADTLGAHGTALNLPKGAATTTIESKTNFFAPGIAGKKVLGESLPLHRGARTMVWQTRVTSEDGRLLALVTQTQIVLEPKRTPVETLTELFTGRSPDEQKALLADLERGGAAMYRAFAQAEADPQAQAALLEAAQREEDNAGVLDRQLGKGDAS